MDSWKLIGTVAGCVVLDLGARFAWNLAKDRGRQEAYEEMEREPHVAPSQDGDCLVMVLDGKKYYLKIEPAE